MKYSKKIGFKAEGDINFIHKINDMTILGMWKGDCMEEAILIFIIHFLSAVTTSCVVN